MSAGEVDALALPPLAESPSAVPGSPSLANTCPCVSEWLVRDLGHRAYVPVWRAMQAFTDRRDETTPDELWLVEHDAVFTLGQAGRAEHILAAGDIPVVQVDRGGQVTYHGPGQLVAYPLIDLRRMKIGVRELVDRVEQAVISTLATFNVDAARRRGAPGVYVGEAKIMALGLRVRRGCSFHGLALNLNMDLSPYQRINPCGFAGLHVTQLLDLSHSADLANVRPALVAALSSQFHLHAAAGPPPLLDAAIPL